MADRRQGRSNVALGGGVGGRSSFREPSTPPPPTTPPPFVPSSPIWFPLHSRPRLGELGGGTSGRTRPPRRGRQRGGVVVRREASRLAIGKAPGPSFSPARQSAHLSGSGRAWACGRGLVLHSGSARGPLHLRWGQEGRRVASRGDFGI